MKSVIVAAVLVVPVLLSGAPGGKEPHISKELLNATQNEFDIILVHDDDDDDGSQKDRAEKVRLHGGKNFQHLPNVRMSTMRANRGLLEQLKKDKKTKLIALDHTVSQAASGSSTYDPTQVRSVVGLSSSSTYKGTGIGVAVLDSGITDLDGFGSGSNCYSRLVYDEDFSGDTSSNVYGHGSHVASILGSNAYCDGTSYSGIAPEANIINLRVLNSLGLGTDSSVIAGINRAIALKSSYNIRVMNLSLGRGVFDSYVNDPLCQAVERAWKAGIVVVVAAGNLGRYPETQGYATISSPGNDPYVITVGAVRNPSDGLSSKSDDTIASYSSKGPSVIDHVVKPDLVAPGNKVAARTVIPSFLTNLYPNNLIYYGYDRFFRMSGTSMATPVVSGAAALMIQKDSTLTPDQVKARLMKTAWKGFPATAAIYDGQTNTTFNVQHDIFSVGAGYLDIAAALANTEKIGSTQSAISPRVVMQNGQVLLTTTYPNVTGVVWGTGTTGTWATGVIWGTNVLMSNGVVWGSGVIWGTNTSSGYGLIWGTGIIWGTANPFSTALSVAGDN